MGMAYEKAIGCQCRQPMAFILHFRLSLKKRAMRS